MIKLNGLITIEGMKFHDIEGGFGEGKKAMLVKDIAQIHEREPKKINELINNNRKRFNDNIDIVDLKETEFAVLLKDSGIYTQNALNASSNIYLLSERGYSKLLKILEDDFAWEQYEKLVDGYFNLRKINIAMTDVQIMARALQISQKTIDEQSKIIELQKPKVEFANAVTSSDSTILVRDLAKILNQNGVNIGANRLFKYLREHGYLIKKVGKDYNSPTQKSMDLGLFEVKESIIIHSGGESEIIITPMVTGKGQQYFIKRIVLKGV